MRTITLGSTGITTPQNAFGALPIQRVDKDTAVAILRRAYEGGMTYFDTARAYSDSEEKMGAAFQGMWDKITVASKTMARTPEGVLKDLDTSLKTLGTDHIDVYQFHCVDQVYAPGDGTGMYEVLEEAKKQGKIGHIAVTAHKIQVAFDLVESGLYEVLQFPFSYISSERALALAGKCKEKGMGYIAMKGLAGGLLQNPRACHAFMKGFDNVVPSWVIQKFEELEQWLAVAEEDPDLDDELAAVIRKDRAELAGSFCRSCGYCMPCPVGIEIRNCARMDRLLRRSPWKQYFTPEWQAKMNRIEDCIGCRQCAGRCPYGLDTPNLLKYMLKDYRQFYEEHKNEL